MAGATAVYGLPFPDALDAPCDFPEEWCAFTGAAQTVLERFEAGAQRVVPAIPIAKVVLSQPATAPEGVPIAFDTVSLDTAGWTDFDANNQVITITRAARYSIVATALVARGGTANAGFVMSVNGALDATVEALDRNVVGVEIGITVQTDAQTVTAGTQLSLVVFRNGAVGDIQVNFASLSVFWVADVETP